jgi:hypothetical protein
MVRFTGTHGWRFGSFARIVRLIRRKDPRIALFLSLTLLFLAPPAGAATIRGALERGDVLAGVFAEIDAQAGAQEVELITRQEFDVWTKRVIRNEEIRDETISCTVESLGWTGGDLFTTGWSWENCQPCKEANPLGINQDARAGLKFAQLGGDLALCLFQAKNRKSDGQAGTKTTIGKWVSRAVRAAIIVNNSYAAITGKGLVKWGQPKPEEALPVVASFQGRR